MTALFSILLGFFSLLSQVILLKEIYALGGGSEIVYGFALGFWLLFGGAGALAAGRKRGGGILQLPFFLVSIPLFSLISLFFIRYARPLLGVLPGEFPPFSFFLASSSCALFFPAFFGGVLFSKLCDRLTREGERDARKIFLYEVLGASLAGLVTIIPLFVRMGQVTALLLAVAVAAGAASIHFLQEGKKGAFVSLLGAGLVACSVASLRGDSIELMTASVSFPSFELAVSKGCERGRFDVLQRRDERFYYFNLERVYASGDVGFVEEMVHLPASFVETPENFLFLEAFSLPFTVEAWKYPRTKEVWVVEGDRVLMEILPRTLRGSAYRLVRGDPVNLDSLGERMFDVISFTIPPPVTLSSVRFMLPRFFRELSVHLAKGGVVYARFPFGGEYLTDEEKGIVRFFMENSRRWFRGIRAVPGDELGIVLSLDGKVARQEPAALAKRLESTGFSARVFRTPLLLYRFDPSRVEWLEGELASASVEKDFFPLAAGLAFHYGRQKRGLDRFVASALKAGKITVFLATSLFLVCVFLLVAGKKEERGAEGTVFFSGASGILAEILVIFSYQVTYGDVYSRVGLLFCAYMVGLLGGAFFPRADRKGFLIFLTGLGVTGFLTVSAFRGGGLPMSTALHFTALACTGFGCGTLFAQSSRISGKTGRLYGIDLVGASVSSILSPFVLSVLEPTGGLFLLALLGFATAWYSIRMRSVKGLLFPQVFR